MKPLLIKLFAFVALSGLGNVLLAGYEVPFWACVSVSYLFYGAAVTAFVAWLDCFDDEDDWEADLAARWARSGQPTSVLETWRENERSRQRCIESLRRHLGR